MTLTHLCLPSTPFIYFLDLSTDSTGSYTELKGFLEESTLMYRFDHPNVLGLVGICFDDSNSPYLILPFMDNGDLKGFLKMKREQDKHGHLVPEVRLSCDVACDPQLLYSLVLTKQARSMGIHFFFF